MMEYDEDGMCCESCMGYDKCGEWTLEIKRYCDHKIAGSYANKSECEALLKYWDDKEGSIAEWRRNNIPMKKWITPEDCNRCMGYGHCDSWIKKCGGKSCVIYPEGLLNGFLKTKYYANKAQTEALLKWHNDRYGSIEQARRDSENDKIKRLDLGSGCWIEIVERDPEEMEKALRDAFDKKETPKPFATLEEFDITIIRFFIASNKDKFYDVCVMVGVTPNGAERIIAGIK